MIRIVVGFINNYERWLLRFAFSQHKQTPTHIPTASTVRDADKTLFKKLVVNEIQRGVCPMAIFKSLRKQVLSPIQTHWVLLLPFHHAQSARATLGRTPQRHIAARQRAQGRRLHAKLDAKVAHAAVRVVAATDSLVVVKTRLSSESQALLSGAGLVALRQQRIRRRQSRPRCWRSTGHFRRKRTRPLCHRRPRSVDWKSENYDSKVSRLVALSFSRTENLVRFSLRPSNGAHSN